MKNFIKDFDISETKMSRAIGNGCTINKEFCLIVSRIKAKNVQEYDIIVTQNISILSEDGIEIGQCKTTTNIINVHEGLISTIVLQNIIEKHEEFSRTYIFYKGKKETGMPIFYSNIEKSFFILNLINPLLMGLMGSSHHEVCIQHSEGYLPPTEF